uniref:Serine/threonine-protein kinase greatwall n=1 Tax=Ditylenchus dipsaci TaxID=166011 RepID=A0A915DNW0_9BILA
MHASSQSPFVLPLRYFFQDSNMGYLVCDLVSLGDLRKFSKLRREMNKEELQFYAANMVLALQYLQTSQIIHWDVKPDNFLFGDDGFC